MVNTNNHNHKSAIVGININGGSRRELDNFERIIYQGKQYNIFPDFNLKINEIVNKAIEDAEVESNAKIAVIIASDEENTAISQADFKNYNLTHAATSKTVFNAIQTAQKLLAVEEVDAVAIASVASPDSPTLNGGLVLINADALKNHQRIYATIDAVTIPENSSPKAQTITQTCQQAFNVAGVKAEDIGYLEICGSSILEPNQLEIKELVAAYQTSSSELTCAVGSLKTNISGDVASEMGSLIKTTLCLYYRYIPAVPQWSTPKYPELWQSSPFYVQTQSKPWFLGAEADKRIAAINGFSNGNIAHLILSESPLAQERDSRYLEQMPTLLFPLAADDLTALIEQIKALETKIQQSDSLAVTAAQAFVNYQKNQNATYAVGIIGRNLKELQRETQRAIKGIQKAFETGGEWKTPVGSYFSAKPLGKKGKVAFVYPGAYSSYVGIARHLFRLFPKILDSSVIKSINSSRVANVEKLLYPRSLNALTKRELEKLEQQLIENPLSMLESGVGFSAWVSAILKDYFGLQPQYCFGFSLGEISMAIAQGIWTDFNLTSSGLNSSELFTKRLSGSKDALREYWGLTNTEVKAEFWRNYVLMADVSQIEQQIKNEPYVYLTQINTPKEVVIAGDMAACQRVINAIGCNAIPAPFDFVMHCKPMASEYDEFVKLHTLPIRKQPEIDFYSAAEYGLFKLESEAMGHSIAKNLCEQFDFPQIVNRLYADDARIFVEAGAGNACSRWIGEILNGREHTTIFLNRRGIDDHTSLLRGFVQLLSHRVEIDLSPLYNLNYSKSKAYSTEVKEVQKTASKSTSPKPEPTLNNQFQNQEVMVTLSPHYWGNFSMQELQTSANFHREYIEIFDFANYEKLDTVTSNENIANFKASSKSINKRISSTLPSSNKLSSLINSHAKIISETNQQSSQSQALFLQARQSSFSQMVKMVELHLSLLDREIE